MNTMSLRTVTQLLVLLATAVFLSIMPGCGGGGGGGTQPAATVVNGTASKGIIYPGTVKVYGVDANGVKTGAPLATVSTDHDGKYTANLGQYAGPVIIEAYGEYSDEATGTKVTIPSDTPLRVAVDVVDNGTNNNRIVAVTPLTDLAHSLVGTTYTKEAIAAANNRVAEVFKVVDIVTTEPVHANPAFMGTVPVSQQAYTMSLATLSQMVHNASGGTPASISQIKSNLESFKNDLAASPNSGLSTASTNAFASALDHVATVKLPGFEDAKNTLANTGTAALKLTLTTGNVPAGVQLGALKGSMTLPAGVSMRARSTGEVLTGLIKATGSAATGSGLVMGNYLAATRQLTFSVVSPMTGFGNGDTLIFTLDVASGTTAKAADFSATITEAKDFTTASTVTGVTATLK